MFDFIEQLGREVHRIHFRVVFNIEHVQTKRVCLSENHYFFLNPVLFIIANLRFIISFSFMPKH